MTTEADLSELKAAGREDTRVRLHLCAAKIGARKGRSHGISKSILNSCSNSNGNVAAGFHNRAA